VADSFYVPLGDGSWRATPHTAGPWDSRSQHGGPPSALLGRAMERCQPRADMMVARFTCEILRAIPVGDINVQARLARPGRNVELLEATASADGVEGGPRRGLAGAQDGQPGRAVPAPVTSRAAGRVADAAAGWLVGRVPLGHRVAGGPGQLQRAGPRYLVDADALSARA